ncbi:MAG: hypothetical protein AAF791_13830 [Bacteroidota bacterium]
MRVAPLLFALLLVGCSDYILERPEEVTEQPAPEPAPELPALSLKGPTEVTVGDALMFKAGHTVAGATYRFEINDATPVLRLGDDDEDRFFHTEVVGAGQSELRVTAIDADGNEIAFARRWIQAYR